MQKAETNSIGIEHQLRNLHDGTPGCFKLLIPEPGTSEAIVVASCPIEPQCRPRGADSIPVGQKELQFLFRRFILPRQNLPCGNRFYPAELQLGRRIVPQHQQPAADPRQPSDTR